jgi:two-component system, OmpR family, phosphate regulon response regulator OmpR
VEISILVVDDDPSFRVAVTALLKLRGFGVSGYAVDQEETSEFVSHCDPDAVLLDMSLPGADGLETLRRLKEMGWPGPVLLTSSNAEAVTNSLALKFGAVGFVPKGELAAADLGAYFRPGTRGS